MSNPFLTKTLAERSKSYETPYEFIFKINNNIIAQRFFSLYNFNPDSIWSYELKEAVDDCVEIIKHELKTCTLVFMDEFKYYFEDDPTYDTNNSPDMYYFQIKLNKRVIMDCGWDATLYPAKIRYDVNIRKHISHIIYLLTSVLSSDDRALTYKYSKRIKTSFKPVDYDPAYSV